MSEKTVEQQIVWDAIERRIEQAPTDGIAANGDRSDRVQREQRKYVDGMRSARLAAIAALASTRKEP